MHRCCSTIVTNSNRAPVLIFGFTPPLARISNPPLCIMSLQATNEPQDGGERSLVVLPALLDSGSGDERVWR